MSAGSPGERADYGGVAMKPFTLIAVVIFAIVALIHVWRLVAGWPIVIAAGF